ncbi:Na+/H+ antiporter [Streptomyces sp. NRRL F-5126]|uniref:Na+/H+ antiporter n=1 Tax=Streptomyces sp. NRRL F-5126 TaxID=1463857 RepID=UPI0004CA18A7|nr:Na+/H+ antiporter [Streptomyces sp. NRRL F-5126]
MASLTVILLLVVLATAVATGARHWKVPAPSLLVVAGLLVGLAPWVPDVRVPPEVISLVVLPPLLHASAEELSARELRPVWRPVAALAFGLVLASAAAVALVASAFTPLSPSMAFVLGAVLASTDPVAVTALGRRLSLPPRVQTMVQGESLFNDATSLVLFKVAVSGAVAAGAVSLPGAAWRFLLLGGGGALIGGAIGGLVVLIRRRTEDPTLETVIALVTPYAAYVVAEESHASGVTAVVVAAVVLGSTGHRLGSPGIRLQTHAVYGTIVFLLESVVFALIGLQLPVMVPELEATEGSWPLWVIACACTVLAVRLLWVFPMSALTQYVRGGRRGERGAGRPRVSWRVPAVVTWAGTRGVVPLAAALSIPLTTDAGQPLPHRALVLVLTTGVVVVTLVGQGFSLTSVVRWSGIALEPEHTVREEAWVRGALAGRALAELDRLAELGAAPPTAVDQARRRLDAAHGHGAGDADGPREETLHEDDRDLRRVLIRAETSELHRLYESSEISGATMRRLQRALDLEQASLGEA